MARVLIVGCGCRGRALARALVVDGHAVRGTTRAPDTLPTIEAAGAEAVSADPGRLATLSPHLEGVSVLCWLLGTASGTAEEIEALHGTRLETVLAEIVDTPVRGLLYEAAPDLPPPVRSRAFGALAAARRTYRMPTAVVDEDPADHAAWLRAASAGVERLLVA